MARVVGFICSHALVLAAHGVVVSAYTHTCCSWCCRQCIYSHMLLMVLSSVHILIHAAHGVDLQVNDFPIASITVHHTGGELHIKFRKTGST